MLCWFCACLFMRGDPLDFTAAQETSVFRLFGGGQLNFLSSRSTHFLLLRWHRSQRRSRSTGDGADKPDKLLETCGIGNGLIPSADSMGSYSYVVTSRYAFHHIGLSVEDLLPGEKKRDVIGSPGLFLCRFSPICSIHLGLQEVDRDTCKRQQSGLLRLEPKSWRRGDSLFS